ncbi:Site-specific recombinase XerD [Nonomuraea solani]|uniref:Site-specific recombinase XerD n=1 Tax=Nonomuraea solani TaxID=1144553 RepID=A0A1H6EX54_9ACTN|nr:hypothetical protein [Nonomuraea solani]SEH01244.1 Site-specific recombinase XerD [Nonomuraea solani]
MAHDTPRGRETAKSPDGRSADGPETPGESATVPPDSTAGTSAGPTTGSTTGPQVAGEGAPEAASVGLIAGLRPRRQPGDGGEVRGVDVDLVDALAPPTRHAVTAWLQDKPSAATRQVRLQVLAAFLRWLDTAEPPVEPLAVTGAHLDDYCDAALSGTLTIGVRNPGKPLSNTTVSRKRAVLSSFYRFAWRHGLVQHDHAIGRQAPDARDGRLLTREDRRLLRRGIARLAAEGRNAEAAAVALLEATGAPVDALASLTPQDLRPVAAGDDGPTLITVHDSRGDIVAFPIPPLARPLLRKLSAGRTAGELLISRGDGHPVDVQWLRRALTDAALAGGIPRQRAELLHPYMMRATTVAELLRDRAGNGMQPPAGMTALVGSGRPR